MYVMWNWSAVSTVKMLAPDFWIRLGVGSLDLSFERSAIPGAMIFRFYAIINSVSRSIIAEMSGFLSDGPPLFPEARL